MQTRRNNSLHEQSPQCVCIDCINDRIEGCRDPHACALEAQTRIQLIFPKFNPLIPGERHNTLSLTRRYKERKKATCKTNGEIIFDLSITNKNNLAECFRIFTDPDKITNIPAKCLHNYSLNLSSQEITIYTDGVCYNNRKANIRSGSGIWIGLNDSRNKEIRVPGKDQSNQAREIAAEIIATTTVPPSWPLKIVTDLKYIINSLTTYQKEWEDLGWIGIKYMKLFRKAAYLLKKRTAPTSFQWGKGHKGNLGNEGSDPLAKEGA